MSRRALVVAMIAAGLVRGALAQDVQVYRDGQRVDPQDVARILGRTTDRDPRIKLRSIRMLDEPESAPQPAAQAAAPTLARAEPASTTARAEPVSTYARAEATPAYPAAPVAEVRPRPSALSLPVQFGFDSADILPRARVQLDALAEGIKLLPVRQSVIIEGHTDSAGTDQYNLQLSLRRAQSVKRYLAVVHGIDEARMKALGMGEYAPINVNDPAAAENRRVQFRGG